MPPCYKPTMFSPSYLSLQPLSKLSLSYKLLLPTPRRASRYFLPLLAFWALLNVSQVPIPPLLPCSRRHHHLRQNARHLDEFWKWAHSELPNVQPCLNFSKLYRGSSSKGGNEKYMMAVVSGGLNQQRNEIIDAVVVARILGAVLVVPVLQVNQVWGDESEFGDIFDVGRFKETLKDDVVVVSSLPSTHLRKRRVRAPLMPFNADEKWIREH